VRWRKGKGFKGGKVSEREEGWKLAEMKKKQRRQQLKS
jgi:hypothetical protein